MAITALAAVLSLFVIAPAAGATVYVVNTTLDEQDGTCQQPPAGDCSLRDALNAANPNAGGDSVSLPAGVYTLTLRGGPVDLVGDTINGAGARTTVIDGGGVRRVMDVTNLNPQVGPPVPSEVSGVTIRNGLAPGASGPANLGGGIQVQSGTLTLVNSTVVGNHADGDGGGIGLNSGDSLVLDHSTVAGNTAGGDGGGIWSANEALVMQFVNSTVSGNTATGEGGAYWGGGGSGLNLFNATVAGNQSGPGFAAVRLGGNASFRNSIIYGNTNAQCSLGGPVTSNNTLAQDATCGLAGKGDITGVNPGLGPLQNNGGPTNTRAIGTSSIAFNHGGAGCQSNDQRGATRPALGACDMGAFEVRAVRLTVVKHVINDQGGTLGAADFNLHVRRTNGADVGGSPAPGSETGRTYSLVPGTYVIREDADSRYTAAIGGSCAANGVVALAEGQSKTCTITNDDTPPRAGKSINGAPRTGVVEVKFPGDSSFHQLTEGDQLPNNTVVDTRKGRITLYVAGKNGKVTHADFYAGLFKLKQSKKGKKLTTLTLVEKLSCKGASKAATTAAKKKRRRRLWGSGKGSFRTKGSHAAATVVGTKWLTQDTCTTTLVKVVRGKVRVQDFVKHKTVLVRKGHKYVAHAKP
jgi:CSLREA domain-containing protein